MGFLDTSARIRKTVMEELPTLPDNFVRTLAEGIAGYAVGDTFCSAETGEARRYQRIAAAPGYEDMGDEAAPPSRRSVLSTDTPQFLPDTRKAIARGNLGMDQVDNTRDTKKPVSEDQAAYVGTAVDRLLALRGYITPEDFGDNTGRGNFAADTAAWQAAITALQNSGRSGRVRGTKRQYAINNLLVTSSYIVLDFNGADLTTRPTIGNAPAIWFRGAIGQPTPLSETPYSGMKSIKIAPADAAKFALGDWILVKSDRVVRPWNYGNEAASGTKVSYGYVGQEELNRIESINTATGQIFLAKRTEFEYNTNDQSRVYKVNHLKGARLENIGSLHEPDPGAAFTGSFEGEFVPHIVSMDYCLDPVVNGIKDANGWNLHLVNMRRCWNPLVRNVIGQDSYRTTIGGHGYLLRFDKVTLGMAERNRGRRTRHTFDYVQCFDIKTNRNIAEEPVATGFGGHGYDSRGWESTHDTVYSSGQIYIPGFNAGNPAFGGDHDVRIISPRGTAIFGIDIGYGSRNVEIVDAGIESFNRPTLIVHSGARNVRMRGGSIKAKYGTPQAIQVVDNLIPTATWGRRCQDIFLDGVEVDATQVGSAGSTTDYAIDIEAGGTVSVTNMRITGGNLLDRHINVNPTSASNVIVIEGNRCFGPSTDAIRVGTAPSLFYSVRDNLTPEATGNGCAVPATALLSFTNNRSNKAHAMSGSVSTALANGAVIERNSPDVVDYRYVPQKLSIAGLAGSVRRILFGTAGAGGVTTRWEVGAGGNPETGANSGSDFEIIGRADDGSYLNTPIAITRANGYVLINNQAEFRAQVRVPGTWDKPFLMGTNRLWIEAATGKLRIKPGVPANDADGSVVGLQA